MGLLLMGRYETFDADEKLAAVQTLSSRPIYGRILTGAIEKEGVPRRDVPAYVARQLHRVVGSGFLEVWGPITRVSSEKTAAIAKYTTVLNEQAIAAADTAHGEQMFSELCGVCHQMFGEGGLIGPDLTGSNRTELDYLLTNIIDPSGDIQDVYQTLMVTTRDGRTYSRHRRHEERPLPDPARRRPGRSRHRAVRHPVARLLPALDDAGGTARSVRGRRGDEPRGVPDDRAGSELPGPVAAPEEQRA